ncbi:MAG: stage sporulation protein [Pyrinomonadaceae bacterium]|nr:stage sporulation protein [Pyrinomonadaceae bacterium]
MLAAVSRMNAVLAAVKNFLFPTHDGARHGLTHVCVCLALFCAWSMPSQPDAVRVEHVQLARVSESEMDAALLRAATAALGSREGAIIVTDAQTGRVRAAVNPRLADEAAFPPGSAIKPFTLLAALRARVINADSRLSCRKHYTRHGADFTCSHPVYIPPFTPTQALAHSCNYYFARLAERLPPADFTHTLAAYGFGASATTTATPFKRASARVDVKTAATMTPRLPRGEWQVKTALGEGDQLLVTPAQLVAAYAALFNGGRLYRTQATNSTAPENFRADEIARLDIAPDERALLLSGLRGAVKYGTASPADLGSLPTHVFGKTGTATDESDGYHTHGWFVGLASERDARPVASHTTRAADAPAPAEVKLAVLVFLKRGQGKESAAVARAVFAEHARLTTGDAASSATRGNDSSTNTDDDFNSASRASNGAALVRVRHTRDELTRTLPLDEYLFGVLAAEASVEDEFAALKAQAVVSRTYALSNLRRHARDNYDFCDTTHCQRFLQVTQANERTDFHALVRRAVADTSGEVLRDARGTLASDVFFSTSCGGQTANLQTLWGTPAREPYQRGGVRDEYCAAMPHRRWTDAIPAARLAKALREDARTDVGARVETLSVIRRDATGRVEQLAIEGERRRVLVRGWDFKIIVGRALGWSVLKSSRFEVMRAGGQFVFRGSGFGHGLGLCQSGAHVMAARGASYRQILAHYFPATSVSATGLSTQAQTLTTPQTHAQATPQTHATTRQAQATTTLLQAHARRAPTKLHEKAASENVSRHLASPARAEFVQASFAHAREGHHRRRFAHASVTAASPSFAGARLTLSSENFRVSYPARGASRREVEGALAALEAARADVRARLAAASIAAPALGVVEAFVHETTGDFTGATGQPAWVAATTRGRRIELQPLATLVKRGLLAPTLRHEYAHIVINALSRSRAPLWLSEGLAAHVAGEGRALSRDAAREKWTREELDKRLAAPASRAEMRALYAAAFREVGALIRAEGEAGVWRRVAGS